MSQLLSTETLKNIQASLTTRQDELLSLIKLLVETESPSGDEQGSKGVCNVLEAAAASLPCVNGVERVHVPDVGYHLVVRAFESQKSNGSVLVVGHTDTVHERNTLLRQPWTVDGDRIFGPGIFDMKANCALALYSLRALEENGIIPNRSVVIALTCDEEIGSFSGWPLLERLATSEQVSSALVLEPPAGGGKVKTGRKGTAMYDMRVEGRAAHAGLEPEKGASAIVELARQIDRLNKWNKGGAGVTINVGVISGGTRSNVVAAEARAEIDVRFSTAAEAKEVQEMFSSLSSFDERTVVTISGGINRPPMERNEKVLSLYQLAHSLATALGFELGETQVGGASDGNFLAAKGVGVLDGLGISGDGAHAFTEHIYSSDIARRGALLAGLIACA